MKQNHWVSSSQNFLNYLITGVKSEIGIKNVKVIWLFTDTLVVTCVLVLKIFLKRLWKTLAKDLLRA